MYFNCNAISFILAEVYNLGALPQIVKPPTKRSAGGSFIIIGYMKKIIFYSKCVLHFDGTIVSS
jgi:hypothetical protein